MLKDQHEIENEKEQGVDGDERCECQSFSVVECLKVENTIEQKPAKKKICLLF